MFGTSDPTYDKAAILANPVWHVAWVLSEIMSDTAPIGWGKYIVYAEYLMAAFEMTPKERT